MCSHRVEETCMMFFGGLTGEGTFENSENLRDSLIGGLVAGILNVTLEKQGLRKKLVVLGDQSSSIPLIACRL